MEIAAGVYPISANTGRILISQRGSMINNPNQWTNWGGTQDEGETPEQTGLREFREESGYEGEVILIPSKIFKDHKVTFYNYFGIVPHEFIPPTCGKETVDGDVEVQDYVWLTLDEFVTINFNYHEGTKWFIKNALGELKYIKNYFKLNKKGL